MLFSTMLVRRQGPAKHAPAENRRQLGPFDGKTQDQRRVADGNGDQRSDRPAQQDGRPGELGIRAVMNLCFADSTIAGVESSGSMSAIRSPSLLAGTPNRG